MKRAKAPDAFTAFVEDQLSDLDGLVTKRMFGGTGLYQDGVFFGLIYGQRLYFLVTDATIGEYKKRRMKPFKPFTGKSSSRRYYEVPLEILESAEDLVDWARAASRQPDRHR